jgi:hypothetical protein
VTPALQAHRLARPVRWIRAFALIHLRSVHQRAHLGNAVPSCIGVDSPSMTLGSPLVSPGFAGYVPAERRQRIGESGAVIEHCAISMRSVGERPSLHTSIRGATTRSLVMSIIPLDLQRRFEQRWAARFSRPNPSDAPRKYQAEKTQRTGRRARQRQKKSPPG